MKTITKIFFGIIIFLVLTVIFRDAILTTSFSLLTRPLMGVDSNAGNVKSDLFKLKITIKDLKLFNPAIFNERIFIHAPLIIIDMNEKMFLEGKWRVDETYIEILDWRVVRNKDYLTTGYTLNKRGIKGKSTVTQRYPFERGMPDLEIEKINISVNSLHIIDETRHPAVKDIRELKIRELKIYSVTDREMVRKLFEEMLKRTKSKLLLELMY